MDVMFAVKELAIYMSAPTLCALQRLRKVIGYLKTSGGMGVKLVVPESGSGKWKSGGEQVWPAETSTDADRSANKQHRKSTSSAIHFVNGSFVYASSRSQRIVSLSSAESELHSMVSGCSDGIYIKRCLEFLTGKEVQHYQWTDNSASRQLVSKQGVGRIRHPQWKGVVDTSHQATGSWPDTHRVELQRHRDQTLEQKPLDDSAESNWSHGSHQLGDDWPGGV